MSSYLRWLDPKSSYMRVIAIVLFMIIWQVRLLIKARVVPTQIYSCRYVNALFRYCIGTYEVIRNRLI